MMNELWLDAARIDWKLLKEQRDALINASISKESLDPEISEGLINFLDSVLDQAECQEIIERTEE